MLAEDSTTLPQSRYVSRPPEAELILDRVGPNSVAIGEVAAEHLTPLLYALEYCAVTMEGDDRTEDASYYRSLAQLLSDAGSREKPKAE